MQMCRQDFGCDEQILALRVRFAEGTPEQFFSVTTAVHFSGVEVCVAEFEREPQRGKTAVVMRAVGEYTAAQICRPEADLGEGEVVNGFESHGMNYSI